MKLVLNTSFLLFDLESTQGSQQLYLEFELTKAGTFHVFLPVPFSNPQHLGSEIGYE